MTKLSDLGLRVVEGGATGRDFGVVILENGNGESTVVSLKREFGAEGFTISDNQDGTVHEFLGDVAYHEGMTTGEVFGLVEKEVSARFESQLGYADHAKVSSLNPSVSISDARISDGVGSVIVAVSLEDSESVYLVGGLKFEVTEDGVREDPDSLSDFNGSCMVLAEHKGFSPDVADDIAEALTDQAWRVINDHGINNLEDLGVKVSDDFSM